MGGGKPLNSKKTLKPKGVSANVTRVTPPIDLLSEDNLKALKISQIKEAIDSYVKNDSYFTAAIDALQKAKNGNLPIGGEYLFRGISACAMGTRNSKALDLAFWAFDVIKVENEAFLKPDSRQCTPIYEALLAVCSRWNDMPRAVGLMEDFQARGHTYTSYILSTYIMLAANDGTSKEVHEILLPLYSTYKVYTVTYNTLFLLFTFPKDAQNPTNVLCTQS